MQDPSRSSPIRIEGVAKAYGAFRALDDVHLDVGAGEFLTLLGPSGSGKTTLLNVISGFVRPGAGRVLFGARDVTLEPPHRRDLGFVFQSYALFPHLSVGENVAFALAARGAAKADVARQVEWALALVKLAGYGERRVTQLSGGQRQRVALARAVAFRPRIILMDEPLSALDKQLREHMQIELLGLHRSLGATIVYVTHDQREALTMSGRIAVMNHGRIVQVATPEAIYHRPATRFVAEFIGETTLVPVARLDASTVRLAGNPVTVAAPLPAGDLALALRSEKMTILQGGATPATNALAGTVSEVIFQGESRIVFVALGEGIVLSVRQLTQRAAPPPEAGQRVLVHLPPEDAVVVPAADP